MQGRGSWTFVLLIGALTLSMFAPSTWACTGIRLTAEDGTVVHARTMEFGVDMESSVIVVPRGYARVGSAPDGAPGFKWTSKYASVGANGVGMPLIVDGVNEKGLSTGLFYFPGMAEYMPYTAADASRTIAPWELGSWVLDHFATVAEVKQGLQNLVVPTVVLKQWGFCPGVHYIVVDATGESIVIEYIDGKLRVYDNPLGVITNCPTFDWHMTNLRNYVNLSPDLSPELHLGKLTIAGFGQGSGMLGMPGDFTPPSRFVRAVAFSQTVQPVKTGDEVVLQAFHLLNNFDIPQGSVRDVQKDPHGNRIIEYTQWTNVCDLKAKRFLFRTVDNSQIRAVDLMKMDLDAKEIVTFSMGGSEKVENLTH